MNVCVVDISNPLAPQIVERSIGPMTMQASQVRVGSLAYLATTNGLEIVDLADPTNAVTVSVMMIPGVAMSVAVIGNYAYVGCEEGA